MSATLAAPPAASAATPESLLEFFERAPAEILELVFRHLTVQDLVAMRLSSPAVSNIVSQFPIKFFRGRQRLGGRTGNTPRCVHGRPAALSRARIYYPNSIVDRQVEEARAAAPDTWLYSAGRLDVECLADYRAAYESGRASCHNLALSCCVLELLRPYNWGNRDELMCKNKSVAELAEEFSKGHYPRGWMTCHIISRAQPKFGYTWVDLARVLLFADWLHTHGDLVQRLTIVANSAGDCDDCLSGGESVRLRDMGTVFPNLTHVVIDWATWRSSIGSDHLTITIDFPRVTNFEIQFADYFTDRRLLVTPRQNHSGGVLLRIYTVDTPVKYVSVEGTTPSAIGIIDFIGSGFSTFRPMFARWEGWNNNASVQLLDASGPYKCYGCEKLGTDNKVHCVRALWAESRSPPDTQI